MKIALLVNPTAGKGKAINVFRKVSALLDAQQMAYDHFLDAWPGHLHDYSSVFLVGGDGSLNAFINKYPDLSIPLAVFKGGSANDFAWKLYGNLSVEEYFNKVITTNPVRIDAGVCNGKQFINGVGIGFDGAVVKAMLKRAKFTTGHLPYLVTVMRTILKYDERRLDLKYDNGSLTEKVFMLTIANGSRFGGGFLVAPDASLNDGKLELVVIKKIAKMKRFFYLPLVEKGKHTHLPFIESLKTERAVITCDSSLPAHVDGEFLESDRFEIYIRTNAFSIYG